MRRTYMRVVGDASPTPQPVQASFMDEAKPMSHGLQIVLAGVGLSLVFIVAVVALALAACAFSLWTKDGNFAAHTAGGIKIAGDLRMKGARAIHKGTYEAVSEDLLSGGVFHFGSLGEGYTTVDATSAVGVRIDDATYPTMDEPGLAAVFTPSRLELGVAALGLFGYYVPSAGDDLATDVATMNTTTALAIINALTPVTFEWVVNATDVGFPTGTVNGFVVDDLEEDLPEAVMHVNTTIGGLALTNLAVLSPEQVLFVLVAAVKELATLV